MRTIHRLTTNYIPHEDRLQLTASDGEGKNITLWMTQRMANRLVERLLTHVEEGVATKASPEARPAVQVMEQAKADLQRQALPPIRAETATEEHLLINVRIRHNDKQVALIFMWGKENSEQIGLGVDRLKLRQWLRIFHEQYKKGAWPLGVWPEWFDETAGTRILGKNSLN